MGGSEDEDDDYAPAYRSIGPIGPAARSFDFGSSCSYASSPHTEFGASVSSFSSPSISRASSVGDETIKQGMAQLLATKGPSVLQPPDLSPCVLRESCHIRPASPRQKLGCISTKVDAIRAHEQSMDSPGEGAEAAPDEPEQGEALTELISMVRKVQLEKSTLERHCRQTAQGLEDLNKQNQALAYEMQVPELSLALEAAGGKRSRVGELNDLLEVSELPVRKQPSQPEAVDIDQLTDSMLIDLLKRETAARDAYSKQIENNNQLIAKLMQHNDELLKQLRELRTDQEMQNQSRRLRDNQ